MVKKSFFFIFLLILANTAFVFSDSGLFAYLNHGYVDGKYVVWLLASYSGNGYPNAKVTVNDSKGIFIEQNVNKNGEFFFYPNKADIYFISICFDLNGSESCTDRKVVYNPTPSILITRRGSNYTICSAYDFGQFEVEDLNKLIIIQQKEGCAKYSTDSERFKVKTAESGLFEATEIEAGRFVIAKYPEKVVVGKPFNVQVFENSISLQGAYVEIAGEKKVTDSKGIASFVLKAATSYEVKAYKEGLQPFAGKVLAVSEFERFELSHSKEAKPLEVFEVLVKHNGEAVEGAVVSVGNTKKPTDSEGKAAFAIADKGAYVISVEKDGFEKRISSITILPEEKKVDSFIVSMPTKIYSTQDLHVVVNSKSGRRVPEAKVIIGDKEATTNIKGEAVISGLTPGNYLVIFKKDGFEDLNKNLEVAKFEEAEPPKPLPLEFFYVAGGISVSVLGIGLFRFWQKRRRRYL
ncbi:MAG: carboxypeptidase-like regulatory domain-containing protein [Candidatus Diapherotrites archaeon]